MSKSIYLTRRGLMLLVISALIAGLFALPPTAAQADTGSNWTGAYYPNRDLQGSPALIRIDPALVFNWGPNAPGPGLGSQNWSARWTGIQYLNAGVYRFYVTVDDGVRLWVDGQLVLDRWIVQAATSYNVLVQVPAGTHAIQVDYFQASGDASLVVYWQAEQTASTAWTAQYYSNPDLAGPAVLTRYETNIDYFWGLGSPDVRVPTDYFSARWTATLPFNAGTYRFTIAADDGVRLYVDDLLVLNQRIGAQISAWSIDVNLSAGLHVIRLEYFEITGPAAVRLNYELALGPPPVINPQTDVWYGEYYPNENLAGSPAFVRYENPGRSGINFNWSTFSPAQNFPRQTFSVRWTRTICSFPGRPTMFYVTVDDGARLYIDSTLIIDAWREQATTSYQRSVDLTAGCHTIRLEYFQRAGLALINMTWNPPDGQNPVQPVGGVVTSPAGTLAARVNTDVLNMRVGPGVSYDRIAQLPQGQILVLSQRNADGSWVLATTSPANLTGWVNSSYLVVSGNIGVLPVAGVVQQPGNGLPQFTGVRGQLNSGLRLRTGPGTFYPQILILDWGTVVDIMGRSRDGQWLQVRYGNLNGWIYSPYVQIVSGTLSNVPITG